MAVEVVNLGCRLNAVEGEAMRALAAAAGLSRARIVNGCAVTAEAVRGTRQAVRRARRADPAARLILTGCTAESDRAAFAAMPEVDAVLPNAEKLRPEAWAALAEGGAPESRPAGEREAAIYAAERTRAHLKVQTGCDHSCTFCIIPHGRGSSRSVPLGDLEAAAAALEAGGCPEIVLTGVDLTSYGADLPGRPTLGGLVKALLRAAPALPRLRLSSIDAAEADADLLDALASEPRLMPHLHLSLQAGDDLVLKRMKRRHSRAQAIAFCAELHRLRPGLALGADLIAGFPTETEEQFRRTLDLVEACGLARVHVFPFSPRPGTPAARMPQVPLAVVAERAARLRDAALAAFRSHLAGELGRTRRVLVERGGLGRTEAFTPVRAPHGEPGTILSMRVTGHDGQALIAEAA
jgi:threonylcarbamoyladenosine tRNA methylthiotransferase MtaB